MSNVLARRNPGFRFTYPLAFLGAHLGFMPLLLLLLPRRVERLAGAEATSVLSLLLIASAVAASIAHVVAGHWSDHWIARHGSRRLPVLAGLLLLGLSYGALAGAGTLASLAAAVIAFQIALNLMFAPLGALLADYVEDRGKGVMAAWLTLALPLSIAASGPIASLFPRDGTGGFALVMLLVAGSVLPLLILWPDSFVRPADKRAGAAESSRLHLADFRRAWAARFLVQCGAAFILFYLYVYLGQLAQSDAPEPAERALALLATTGGLAGAAAAIALGRLSDRLEQRRWPVAVSAAAAALGLLLLAAEPGWLLIMSGYALFSGGLTAFLALDNALVAQMLGGNPARGRWLGIMNLTNTLPAILVSTVTLLALEFGSGNAITVLLLSTAALNLVAAALVLGLKSIR